MLFQFWNIVFYSWFEAEDSHRWGFQVCASRINSVDTFYLSLHSTLRRILHCGWIFLKTNGESGLWVYSFLPLVKKLGRCFRWCLRNRASRTWLGSCRFYNVHCGACFSVSGFGTAEGPAACEMHNVMTEIRDQSPHLWSSSLPVCVVQEFWLLRCC